jgi:methionine-gamma-lyase
MAVYRMFHELFNQKFGVETVMVDMTDLDAVRKAITPGTKLVHIETPDNPTVGITDIAAIAEIAHENGAILSVDNTFASPYNQRPLDLGADFVVEALTKFVNGHGDAQGGAIISNDLETMDRIRYEAQVNVGSVISPFNAWQIFRGSVTFPLRMQRINDSTLKIARWLETRKNVTFVAYPGLESNPGYELAKRQMKNGYGGVISFGLDTDDKTVERFCAALKVVTFAVSLGHDESLIFPQPSYDERILLYPEKFRKGFIRFSVGLEEPDDIIRDLDQALSSVGL